MAVALSRRRLVIVAGSLNQRSLGAQSPWRDPCPNALPARWDRVDRFNCAAFVRGDMQLR